MLQLKNNKISIFNNVKINQDILLVFNTKTSDNLFTPMVKAENIKIMIISDNIRSIYRLTANNSFVDSVHFY